MANERDLQRNRAHAPCEQCASELRCECGNLIARLVAGRVELKCRRCKRTIMLPISPGAESDMA
jgi:hypothetical protein